MQMNVAGHCLPAAFILYSSIQYNRRIDGYNSDYYLVLLCCCLDGVRIVVCYLWICGASLCVCVRCEHWAVLCAVQCHIYIIIYSIFSRFSICLILIQRKETFIFNCEIHKSNTRWQLRITFNCIFRYGWACSTRCPMHTFKMVNRVAHIFHYSR